jgi:uncharacterized protein YnzC (UPF0291/DUF896 family)
MINDIRKCYQQMQTIEAMKIVNEKGEDIRNINA